MTQLLSIDDDFHAALKMMSADPTVKRGMKQIAQEALLNDKRFAKYLADARQRLPKTKGDR